MKVRNVGGMEEDTVQVPMTPMIDIVFQLLIFFILTFKIVSQEGDFNIKMPAAAPSQGLPDEDKLPPMKVRLRGYASGQLAQISLNDNNFNTSFESLHNYIISIIGDERGPGSVQDTAEVELDCDYDLKYENVVKAVTAVSGFIDEDRNIVKLVEKIKFAQPRPSGN